MTIQQAPDLPPGFTAVSVFDDPTPNTIILHRIVLPATRISSQYTDLTTNEANDVLDLVFLIARKMASVWKHLDGYQSEAGRLAEKFSDPGIKHGEYSQVLYEEFDVFTVQIKSTLDHLVKIMRPMVGSGWTLHTFADKGEGVLRALKHNTGKKYLGRVAAMEKLLFAEHHREWLGALIDTRDRVNHGIAGGLKISNFAVLRRPDGTVELPRWSSEQSLGDAMKNFWALFFSFVEDFVVLALNFRIFVEKFSICKGLKGVARPDSPESPWAVLDAATAQRVLGALAFRPTE